MLYKEQELIIAIVVALVAVSTAIVIMSDREDSSAADLYDSNIHVAKIGDYGYETLQAACDDATNGAVIEVTCDIELDTTLRITKPLTLTTNCGATISPSAVFVAGSYTGNRGMTLVHVDGDNYSQDGTRIGKLTLGLNTPSNPNEILTLDGGGKCRVIHAEMRRSPAGVTLTINSAVITNGSAASNAAGVRSRE